MHVEKQECRDRFSVAVAAAGLHGGTVQSTDTGEPLHTSMHCRNNSVDWIESVLHMM